VRAKSPGKVVVVVAQGRSGATRGGGFLTSGVATRRQLVRKRLGAGPRASRVLVDHPAVPCRRRRSGGDDIDAGNVEVVGTTDGGTVGGSSGHRLRRGRGQ
jgi:hypothetical protein